MRATRHCGWLHGCVSSRRSWHPDTVKTLQFLAACLVLNLGCQTPERLVSLSRQQRLEGHMESALDELLRALELSDQSGSPPSPEALSRLREEIGEAKAFLNTETQKYITDGIPLSAAAKLQERARLLRRAEFRTTGEELHRTVLRAGQERCLALWSRRPGVSSPYLSQVIDQYCAHFRSPTAEPIDLPDCLSSLEIDGSFEGATAADMTRLAIRLQDAYRNSAYFSAASPRAAVAGLRGFQRLAFSQHPTEINQVWIEQVPYSASETYQEPSRESYTDFETYSEQVPYTTMETYSYSCGFGSTSRTCTGSRLVTQSRSETRTRSVTKWRTVYRTAWRTVTRYRPTERLFKYSAVEHRGQYAGHLVISIQLGTEQMLQPLVVEQREELRLNGWYHDVTFAPAGITPKRPGLPAHETWVDLQLQKLGTSTAAALAQHWASRFCRADTYSMEEAARCARLRTPELPGAVRAKFTEIFGADTPYVLRLP